MDKTLVDELFDAVSRNDVNGVKSKLRKDVNVNTISSTGFTPLGVASLIGNVVICESLIENYKCSLNNTSSSQRSKKVCVENTPNGNQAQHKNVGYYVVNHDLNDDTVAEFGDGPTPEGMEGLEWDVEIKESDTPATDTYSCLYKWYADILNQTSDLIKIPPRCDVNQIDYSGRTALHYASERGHTQVVRSLLSVDSDVNVTTPDGVTPLQLACNSGHYDIVKLLVQNGARLSHVDNNGTSALHLAANRGYLKIVQLLIEYGANLDVLDSYDQTPLFRAISQKHLKIVEFLVRSGCRLNLEDSNGFTALCEAVWMNSLSTVQLLIDAGAKITQSHCLLHYSVSNNHLDVTKMLVKAGSVVNLRDENGNTPLIVAVKLGRVDAAKFLLEHGAMVNLPNALSLTTPLYEAVDSFMDSEHTEFRGVLELLLNHGAGIDMQSNVDTPLFRAIFTQKPSIAAHLIRYGADVNFVDDRIQVDCVGVARKNNDLPLVRLLIYAGYELRNYVFDSPADQITDWLHAVKSNPMSLMDLCRLRIRKELGEFVYWKIERLDLPKSLCGFLRFEDLM